MSQGIRYSLPQTNIRGYPGVEGLRQGTRLQMQMAAAIMIHALK